MWCTWLDVQPESKIGQFLAKKRVSLITGYVQLILWIIGLFNYIFPPNYLKELIQSYDNVRFALSIILTLVVLGFSVLLLLGLYKDRADFIKIYLVFAIVFIVLSIISIIYALFTRPEHYGVFAYFAAIFVAILQILFYFIIRNYYLSVLQILQLNENPA